MAPRGWAMPLRHPNRNDLVRDLPDARLDSEMRQALGEYYEPLRLVKTINRQSAIQARLPFYLNIN